MAYLLPLNAVSVALGVPLDTTGPNRFTLQPTPCASTDASDQDGLRGVVLLCHCPDGAYRDRRGDGIALLGGQVLVAETVEETTGEPPGGENLSPRNSAASYRVSLNHFRSILGRR